MLTIVGQCTGGLSCDGGCCRKITLIDGQWVPNGYCDHYEVSTGMCMIYDKRAEMGYAGCPTFPTVDMAVRNGLPDRCGYKLVDVESIT